MKPTRDEILAKGKELGVTLTDAEIEKHLADGTLPEKSNESYLKKREELRTMTAEQLIDKYFEAAGEAKDRRLENKELKQQIESMTRDMGTLKESASKYPELEKQYKTTEATLQAIKDSEKKRREAAFAKLDDRKKSAFSHLLNVDAVGGDAFDSSFELLVDTKSPGMISPSPAGAPPATRELTAEERREANRLGLSEKDFAEIQDKRKSKQGVQK